MEILTKTTTPLLVKSNQGIMGTSFEGECNVSSDANDWISSNAFSDDDGHRLRIILDARRLIIARTEETNPKHKNKHERDIHINFEDILSVYSSTLSSDNDKDEFTTEIGDQSSLNIVYLPKSNKRTWSCLCPRFLSRPKSSSSFGFDWESVSADSIGDIDDDDMNSTTSNYVINSKAMPKILALKDANKQNKFQKRKASSIKTIKLVCDDNDLIESWKMKLLIYGDVKRHCNAKNPASTIQILSIVSPSEQHNYSKKVAPVLNASKCIWKTISINSIESVADNILDLDKLDCIMIMGGGDETLEYVNNMLRGRKSIPIAIIPTSNITCKNTKHPVSQSFCEAFLLKNREALEQTNAAFLAVKGKAPILDMSSYFPSE